MRYLLIMNAGSRSGKGKHLWKSWESGLVSAGVDYSCVFTESQGHAFSLARDAEADVVVAVGGDGTINEVIDGVIQSGNPDLRMGVLYAGTSPDFCKFHQIPINPAEALDALLNGECRKVDAVRIRYRDIAGEEVLAHFCCSCNIGMGASVARFANRWRRYLGDVLGTGLGVICAIARNSRVEVSLEIDGKTQVVGAMNNLTIAKNPYIASGLRLQLDLRPDDGKLYLVGMHSKGRSGILRLLPKYYSGAVTSDPGIIQADCRSVVVTSTTRQEIEFDGDPRGYLPARIDLMPKALSLIGGRYE